MWRDKIVEEVRKTREKICVEFDFDLKKYSKYIIESQNKNSGRLVSKEKLLKTAG